MSVDPTQWLPARRVIRVFKVAFLAAVWGRGMTSRVLQGLIYSCVNSYRVRVALEDLF